MTTTTIRRVVALACVLLFSNIAHETEACTESCPNFSPQNCLGTLSPTGFSQSGFTTSTITTSQKQFECGSRQSGLNDRVFQFAVPIRGLYRIKTFDIGNFDTTLQVMNCDNSFLDCSDDVVFDVDKSSLITVPLEISTQYVALVSKYDSNSAEPTFSFAVQPICTCTDFAPNACFGTILQGQTITRGRFSTDAANVVGQTSMQCGSQDSGLKDFTFHFQVAVTGSYSIETTNLNAGDDTTLQIIDCGGTRIACNDNRADIPGSLASRVVVTLNAGTAYVGLVSKFNTASQEVNFDIITTHIVTPAPTPVPTTKAPSNPPTFTVTAAPTNAAVTLTPTVAVTATPTNAAVTLAPATNQPTSLRPTTAAPVVPSTLTPTSPTTPRPTTNGTEDEVGGGPVEASAGGDSSIIFIGGGVGGGAVLVALGLVLRRRSAKRRESIEREAWTDMEEATLRQVYQTTHDFDFLCGQFAHKSRESVAFKVKTMLEAKTQSTGLGHAGAAMLIAPPQQDSYSFVQLSEGADRPIRAGPRLDTSPTERAVALAHKVSNRLPTKETVSSSLNHFKGAIVAAVGVGKPVAPPPGLGGHHLSNTANPMFGIPSHPSPPWASSLPPPPPLASSLPPPPPPPFYRSGTVDY